MYVLARKVVCIIMMVQIYLLNSSVSKDVGDSSVDVTWSITISNFSERANVQGVSSLASIGLNKSPPDDNS